jgi:hypothetical protein
MHACMHAVYVHTRTVNYIGRPVYLQATTIPLASTQHNKMHAQLPSAQNRFLSPPLSPSPYPTRSTYQNTSATRINMPDHDQDKREKKYPLPCQIEQSDWENPVINGFEWPNPLGLKVCTFVLYNV